MSQVGEATSADGTTIAYEALRNRTGGVIVGGAFCDRGAFRDVAQALGGLGFTGVTYDRGAGATAATPSPTRSPARSRT